MATIASPPLKRSTGASLLLTSTEEIETILSSLEKSGEAEHIIDSLQADLKDSISKEINLLMIGKTGTGKTSLASAILKGKSAKGSFGAKTGTTDLLVPATEVINGVTVNVYDIRGLYDGTISTDNIIQAVQQELIVDKLNAVVCCFKWSDRLDKANKEVLRRIHQLCPDIWKKVVFALTFCDQLPPDMEHKRVGRKCAFVQKKWKSWERKIKLELETLQVSSDIIRKIQIVPTTHTCLNVSPEHFSFITIDSIPLVKTDREDPSCLPWLKNIWIRFLHNAINYETERSNFLNLYFVRLSYENKQSEVYSDTHSENPSEQSDQNSEYSNDSSDDTLEDQHLQSYPLADDILTGCVNEEISDYPDHEPDPNHQPDPDHEPENYSWLPTNTDITLTVSAVTGQSNKTSEYPNKQSDDTLEGDKNLQSYTSEDDILTGYGNEEISDYPDHEPDPNHQPDHQPDPNHQPDHEPDPNHDPDHQPDPNHNSWSETIAGIAIGEGGVGLVGTGVVAVATYAGSIATPAGWYVAAAIGVPSLLLFAAAAIYLYKRKRKQD